MKYPERMARRGPGARPFHTAIATTFSMEFAAYEEVMLPQLMASGATNFVVVADERMASMSLSDGSQLPMQLGRDYELISPPVSDGLFHPKIVLQIGRKAGRLFVGSANITAAGLAGNAETVVELECQAEPSPEREIVRSAWRYISNLIPQEPSAARDALNWANDRAQWLSGSDGEPLQHLEDGSAIAFLTRSGREGIGGRFLDFIGGDRVERLVVASPYWDGQLDGLRLLLDRLHPDIATILLDAEGHEFPLETSLPHGLEFRAFPSRLDGRFKHSKFVIASTATHDHLFIGSANCTKAALGGTEFGGTNHEACIYRMLPRDRAVEALGLMECIEAEPVDPEDIEQREAPPPIPLDEIASRKAGCFELDGALLTWFLPRGVTGSGRLFLLDARGSEVDSVAFHVADEPEPRMSFPLTFEKPERVSFARVEQEGFLSNRAHVTHRGLLRRRRREVATGSVAKAVAAFDTGEDFDLWMHSAFEELARADLNDRPPPSIAPARPRQAGPEGEEEAARELSYDEFMETRSPDSRGDDHRDSTLAGTHADSIRGFLNMLVGRTAGTAEPGDSGDDGDDWMDLGDEDEERELEAETQRTEEQDSAEPEELPPNLTPVDAKQFERMVRLYAANVTTRDGALGPSDVLRVRFWLMMLLHKAKHSGLPHGLEMSSEEQGWPRMALRVIAAFFCGRKPPITRLMIAREYTEMPVDFLECWATVLWTLEAIDGLLSGSVRHRQFLGFVQRARAEVVKMLGLTPSELASNTMIEMRDALDGTLGIKFGLSTRTAA